MASYNGFNQYVEDLGSGVHNLSTDTLKIYLTNTAPVATNEIKSEIAEITAENGYPSGGVDVTNTFSQVSGTATLDGTDVVFTASGGSFGPFRYLVLYNDTPTSPLDPLIGWYDYGSSVSVNDGETLTYSITTNIMTITIA
jgi:hypothetical protein